MRLLVLSAISLQLGSVPAQARPQKLSASGTVLVDTRCGALGGAEALDNLDYTLTAGATLRAVIRRGWLAYAAGLDYQFGGGVPGGFAYEVNLYPLGIGTNLGRVAYLAVVIGVGASGVTPHRMPFAVQFPAELYFETELGARLRLRLWGRAAWTLGAEARASGTPSAAFADESALGATLRLGRRIDKWRYRSGNGYYLGASYAERMGMEVVTVMFGYSVNFGYHR